MVQLSVSGKGMHWRFEKLVGSHSIMPFYHTLNLVLCTNARCSSVRTLGMVRWRAVVVAWWRTGHPLVYTL